MEYLLLQSKLITFISSLLTSPHMDPFSSPYHILSPSLSSLSLSLSPSPSPPLSLLSALSLSLAPDSDENNGVWLTHLPLHRQAVCCFHPAVHEGVCVCEGVGEGVCVSVRVCASVMVCVCL